MLAWIMVLVGTPIAVGAFYFAIKPIVNVYQQAAIDPLADAMPADGKGVAKEMIVPAAVGVVFGGIASAGSLMLFVTKRRRRAPKQ